MRHDVSPEIAAQSVIVFERRPRWTPELERQFVGENVRVRACTDLRDALPLVEQPEPPVLVLDLEADTAGCLRLLARLMGAAPLVPIICVASSQSTDLEWAARELGALDFAAGPIPGERLANLCRRQWRI